jgi:hypothetical protein
MVAAYKRIDCTTEEKTVYISCAATGNGRAMVGVSGWIRVLSLRC